MRVARAKNFSGPYQVYEGNPLLSENDKWKCMGHGTFVKGPDSRDFYLHHAYNKESTVFTGRQALISELVWPKNNEWPVFKSQQIVGDTVPDIHDHFNAQTIGKYWQWDFRNSSPVVKQKNGVLYLSGNAKPGNQTGIALTSRPVSDSFVMGVTVLNSNAALKGLVFYGDASTALGIGTENDRVILWQVRDSKFSVLAEAPTIGKSSVDLRLELNMDKTCKFYYKQGKNNWKSLISADSVKVVSLSQWDRSPRAGVHFKGDKNLNAQFAEFSIKN